MPKDIADMDNELLNDNFLQMKQNILKQSKDGYSIINLEELEVKEVSWLFYPYIPFGKITILQGDAACGKTTFALNLAALLSKGLPLPVGNQSHLPMKVIYHNAEDGLEDTILPRLIKYGADITNIKAIKTFENSLTLDDDRIEKMINELDAKLFVLDPLQAFLGAGVDMNRANVIRPIFSKLGQIAEKTGCAIIIIGHLNKGRNKALYRGLGSTDITAAARSVLLAGRSPDDESIRAVVPVKASLAHEGKAVAFCIDEKGFNWLGESELTAEQILYGKPNKRAKDKAEELIMDKCLNTLFPSLMLEELATQQGISISTLKRAKLSLDTDAERINGEWFTILRE